MKNEIYMTCTRCGGMFKSKYIAAKFCPDCNSGKNESYGKKKFMTLSQVARLAAKAGLSYGQYVARYKV